MEATSTERQVVGIAPWLPWPLSAWSWWTEPVRAERLAAFRIALAACLIFDISYNYAPLTHTLFGKGALGDPEIFDYCFRSSRMNWSLLRGVGDGALQYLSLLCLIFTTLWITCTSLVRLLFVRKNPPVNDRTGYAMYLWMAALAVYVLGLWSHMIVAKGFDFLAWIVPLLGFTVLCLFAVLDIGTRLRQVNHPIPWFRLALAFSMCILLIVGGAVLAQQAPAKDPDAPAGEQAVVNEFDKDAWFIRVLGSWQADDETREGVSLIKVAVGLWIGFATLLMLGIATRLSAIATWLLSMSFANSNPYLDNAGDTIRLILLFYLMLCPSGAAWSIDALFARRQGPVYVHPWVLRVIFVQMIFIYFMNGLYKLFGANWIEGSSLYYVLGDVCLARFSQVMLPVPYFLTRIMTWSVLAWEVGFPLLVIFKWPRRFALVMGVMFHLGIFATMELGGFVPYALCMYVPLLPWEWLAARRTEEGNA